MFFMQGEDNQRKGWLCLFKGEDFLVYEFRLFGGDSKIIF